MNVGKSRRIRKLFSQPQGKTIIVPLDDSLLAGPENGLEDLSEKVKKIVSGEPNGIIAFQGLLKNFNHIIKDVPCIMNLTASTSRSIHTRKILTGSLDLAIMMGVDAVAVHVNISSKHEREMIGILGMISCECEKYGIPLLAIIYARGENPDGSDNNYLDLRKNNNKEYSKLVAHAARIGLELGADIIKTQYTGDEESFSHVINVCKPIPVIVAGGSKVDFYTLMKRTYDIMKSGAAGVSYGRNIFSRDNPLPYIQALKSIVLKNEDVNDVIAKYKSKIDE